MIEGDVATSAAPAQVAAGSTSGPSASTTGRPPSAAIASREVRGRPAVVDRHPCPGVGEEPGEGQAAAGQPEDRDRPVAQGAGTDVVQPQPVQVDRVGGGHGRHWSRFSEARKSVTPSSAARMPTIQKRIVIFSSSHPPSSKWWWIGLIRKSRLPPVSLK